MRDRFIHEALLLMDLDADGRAPGGAITMALCGHWEHDGECRWPHHTVVAKRSQTTALIRTTFQCEPREARDIHRRISQALGAGRLDHPDGTTHWTVLSDEAVEF